MLKVHLNHKTHFIFGKDQNPKKLNNVNKKYLFSIPAFTRKFFNVKTAYCHLTKYFIYLKIVSGFRGGEDDNPNRMLSQELLQLHRVCKETGFNDLLRR